MVTGGGLPADLLDLPLLRDPVPLLVLLLVGLGLVIRVARLRGPVRAGEGVEGPERQVGAGNLRQLAGLLEGVGPEPEVGEPVLELLDRLLPVNLERNDRLRADQVLAGG